MTKEEYVKFVKEGASKSYNPNLALIALIEEVGEVAGLIKKKGIYPDFDFIKKYGDTFENEVKDELGDVLWQYINLLNQLNIDLDDIINHNVEKLEKRHSGNKTANDGGKR